jgi:predicted AlkP superfamily pyrophosphatase or phosphodiesterase
MKNLISALFLTCSFIGPMLAVAQSRPKLVVGIVVDQMRYDYLHKYMEDYGEGGFRKLLSEGYSFDNAAYNFVPTYTGPGHASIYTGTTPARHGIVANDWIDPRTAQEMYCVRDNSVKTTGSKTDDVGRMSPRNLIASTIGDELKIASNKRSKVFGIALKDRSAILPAGHAADAAYWFDGESGCFVSSSYYTESLPLWLAQFNSKQLAMKYLGQTWDLLLPAERYDESLADENPYEGKFTGKDKPTFPYNLKELMLSNGGQNLIRSTPFGNTFTADLAKELIANEELGKDEHCDILAISFSSPDYIGHKFGTDARETQDCYLRLDRDLADLIAYTEEKVGKGNVVFFLTADHGGANVPAYLMDQRIPGGYMDYTPMRDSLNTWLSDLKLDAKAMHGIFNEQIYLNRAVIQKAGQEIETVENHLASKLQFWPGVQQVLTASNLQKTEYTRELAALVQRGYHPQRSGNIVLALQPNWMEYSRTGTTHGTPWSYDTRVPLIWYGGSIAAGNSIEAVYIDDIAPTLSILLQIPFPNALTGKPLSLPTLKK